MLDEPFFNVVNYSLRILASEHIFAPVFEGDEEAIGGVAVVAEVFAEIAVVVPAPVSEQSFAATDASFAETWSEQFDRIYVGKRY